jgi:imidazole glycerol-phosphate synthase subunit HisH
MSEANAGRVAIIDYQMGNLFSVRHACVSVGLEPVVTSDPDVLRACDAAILPGVGAFGEAMENITRLDLAGPIRDFIAKGKPFFGVCLGLQLLFTESEEFGAHRGLDLIPGLVKRFSNAGPAGASVKVPQIGWNQINPPPGGLAAWERGPLAGVSPEEYMYFVHSYYVKPDRASDVFSVTRYGGLEYCSSIRRENIFATQFHPEKSAKEGLRIYRNWAAIIHEGKV